MSVPETPVLPSAFLDNALRIDDSGRRVRWYMCTIVSLSSLNYPDVIPQVYEHFNTNLLSGCSSFEERGAAINQLREALIKSTGIVGAGRTGNAIRALSGCIPGDFRATNSPRAMESQQTARERGKRFWTNIYARNAAFDPEASVRASPDYAFVVRGKFHGPWSVHYYLTKTLQFRYFICPRVLLRWRSRRSHHWIRHGIRALWA